MLKRRIQDLTVCFTYNFSCLHPQHRGQKDFRSQYRLCEEIQRGGFGIVYNAYRTSDGLPVAVKYVEHRHVREWKAYENQLIPTEICHLDLCKDIPGVVGLIDWFASSKGFMIVMERPEKCLDLFDVISMYGRLDEEVARWIFVQIVDAVLEMKTIHSLVHRDIKDENVIVDMESGVIKLVDLGAADFVDSAMKKHFQGTRSYCPPEWFKHHQYLPLEATSWSLGVLLYILVVGTVPFKNEIQTCLGRLHFPSDISSECQQLIRCCLCITPKRRITLAEIRSHPWTAEATLSYAGSFRSMLRRRALDRGHWQSSSSRSRQARVPRRRNSVVTISDAESEEELETRLRGRQLNNGALVVPPAVLAAAAANSHSGSSTARTSLTPTAPTPPLSRADISSMRSSLNRTPTPTYDPSATRMATTASVYEDCQPVISEVQHRVSTSSFPRPLSTIVQSNVQPAAPMNPPTRHPRIGHVPSSRNDNITTSFDVFRSVASTISSTGSTRYESLTGSTYQPRRMTTQDDDELASLSCSQSSAAYFSAHESLTSDDELADSAWYEERNGKPRPPYASEEFWLTNSILAQTPSAVRHKKSDVDVDFVGYDLRSLLDDDGSPNRTRTPSVDTDTEHACTPPASQPTTAAVGNGLRAPAITTPASSSKAGDWQRLSVAVDENGILSTTHTPRAQRREGRGGNVQRWFSGIRRAKSLKIPFRGAGGDKAKTNANEVRPKLSVTAPKPPSSELPVGTVGRLAAHSYDALVALGGAIADRAESTARLRDQLNVSAGTKASAKKRPISAVSMSLGNSKTQRSRSRPNAPTGGQKAKPNGNSLQYETMRFPLAVFDVCAAQQLPLLEQVK